MPEMGRSQPYRAEGIVLGRRDLGDADRIVTLFTREFGRRRLVARGSRRPASHLAPSIELFNRVRILGAVGSSLDILKQVEELESHPRLRTDLAAFAAAGWSVELLDGLSEDNEPSLEALRRPAHVPAGTRPQRRPAGALVDGAGAHPPAIARLCPRAWPLHNLRTAAATPAIIASPARRAGWCAEPTAANTRADPSALRRSRCCAISGARASTPPRSLRVDAAVRSEVREHPAGILDHDPRTGCEVRAHADSVGAWETGSTLTGPTPTKQPAARRRRIGRTDYGRPGPRHARRSRQAARLRVWELRDLWRICQHLGLRTSGRRADSQHQGGLVAPRGDGPRGRGSGSTPRS